MLFRSQPIAASVKPIKLIKKANGKTTIKISESKFRYDLLDILLVDYLFGYFKGRGHFFLNFILLYLCNLNLNIPPIIL